MELPVTLNPCSRALRTCLSMGSVSAAYASFAFLRSWRIISMMVGTTPFRTFQSGRISDSKMEPRGCAKPKGCRYLRRDEVVPLPVPEWSVSVRIGWAKEALWVRLQIP